MRSDTQKPFAWMAEALKEVPGLLRDLDRLISDNYLSGTSGDSDMQATSGLNEIGYGTNPILERLSVESAYAWRGVYDGLVGHCANDALSEAAQKLGTETETGQPINLYMSGFETGQGLRTLYHKLRDGRL